MQSVSEAGENKTSSLDSPIILNRSIQTTILAKDRNTVVLGGLISENKSILTPVFHGWVTSHS